MTSRSFEIGQHHSDAKFSSMAQSTPPQFHRSIIAGSCGVHHNLIDMYKLFLEVDENLRPIVEEVISKPLREYQAVNNTIQSLKGPYL